MPKRRAAIALAVLVVAFAGLSFLLNRFWYQPTYSFIFTDNARIEGARVKVVADHRGQVERLLVDTGDEVQRRQPVAILKVISSVSAPTDTSTPKYIYQNVLSPSSGIVVSREVDVGNTVTPGQPLLTIADLNDIWVIANIDENVVTRVQPGQEVDIHVDATGAILKGRVGYVVPSTASVVQRPEESPLVVAANTQDVPVKISLESKGDYQLYPGLSVEVTIYTR